MTGGIDTAGLVAATQPTFGTQRLSRPGRGKATAGYWDHAWIVAALILATVGLRVHENVPHLNLLRPAALAAYVCGAVLISQTSRAVVRGALRDRTLLLFVGYFVWMTVTAPFALWPGLALSSLSFGPPTFALLLALLLCPPSLASVERSALSYITAIICLGVLAEIFGATAFDAGVTRLSANGSLDSNDLAAVMAMAFPFASAFALRERRWRRVVGIVGMVTCALVLVKTGSRGGTIALLAGATVFTLGLGGGRRMRIGLLLSACAGAGWYIAPQPFRDRISSITSMEDDYNYTAYSGRKQIWARGREYIAEHPVAGVGVGNFPIAEGDFAAALGRPAKWSAAHNAYVQAFAELGFVGGSLFIALLLSTLARAWRLFRERNSAVWHRPEYAASVCAFAISAYFLAHAYFYPFFALCGLVALADRSREVSIGVAAPVASHGLARSRSFRSKSLNNQRSRRNRFVSHSRRS